MFRSRRDPFLAGADAERVRRVLYLNGLRAAEIDDAMQEIELRALERPPREPGSRRAWACVVATNLAMDTHRRTARHAEGPPAEQAASSDDAGMAALRDAVRAGLAELEPQLRATVVLRFYADFPIAEIAAAMGVPEGTVKSRLHRAVTLLRGKLTQEVVG
jgi:RNA polymerase sigma-70 factor, ECF subfamily